MYPSSGSDRVRHNAVHTDKTPLGAEWGVSAPLAGVSGEYISRVRDAPLVLRTLLGAESVAEVNELSQAYVDRATRLWRDQNKPNQGSVERGLWVGLGDYFDVIASVGIVQSPALRVMERA
jgi:hypothetical protein